MINLKKIKEIYTNGGNIIEYLKSLKKTRQNDISDILISYDFQAGSYTEFAKKIRNILRNIPLRYQKS